MSAPDLCTCGQDARSTHVCYISAPLGVFSPLPVAEFERLLARGAESVREFDAMIAPMFTLGPEAQLVLR